MGQARKGSALAPSNIDKSVLYFTPIEEKSQTVVLITDVLYYRSMECTIAWFIQGTMYLQQVSHFCTQFYQSLHKHLDTSIFLYLLSQNRLFLQGQSITAYSINKQKQMEQIDKHAFTLIKCEPDQILFVDRNSRLVYRYLDSARVRCQRNEVQHPQILSGIPFQEGFLYLKEQSTLLAQITQRARSHIKQQFSQEEIVNTFEPLFQCLQYLHEKGITHGSVHLDSIVISNDQIKIRDWNAPTALTCQYYPSQKQPFDDIKALGLCLLNCVLLTTQKPLPSQRETILEQIVTRYSKPFALALVIILNEHKEQFPQIVRLFKGKLQSKDSKLIEAYQTIRSQKDRKKKLEYEPSWNSPGAALKKHTFGIVKKVFHHENIENKLESEKKMAENGAKKHERSALAYELVSKKFNEQQMRLKEESVKRVASKPAILNLSNFGVENNSKKLQRQRISPLAKSRNYSRKK